MPGYRLDSIADLARQLAFAPHEVRARQLDAAEELLLEIEPNKAYPLELVVFRLTGYRPRKTSVATELLTGLALQHDLGELIETVSDTLDVEVSAVGEPVLTIEDVSERFNVASKTIQRWRRRGLPARRFVFAKNKRRVGFLVRSVERFVAAHSEELPQQAKFGALTAAEASEILRRAERLAGRNGGGTTESEICRRIGRKLGRAALTVLHTLRAHDLQNPAKAILPRAVGPISEDVQPKVARAFRRGNRLEELARENGVPRTVVYRAILDDRIERLSRRKHKFIDDSLYHSDQTADHTLSVLREMVRAEELAAPRAADERVPKDLPPYFQSLYRTPLLTPGRERALFLLFNYHKYLFVTARKALDSASARSRDIAVLEKHLKDATAVKNAIVAANLRLVVSVARKHLRPALDLMELVSDGNITLMRAVEGFDVHKGNKFSTYATLALMKGYARSVPLMMAAKAKAGRGDEMLGALSDGRATDNHRLVQMDHLRSLLKHLTPPERAALLTRFEVGADSHVRHGLEVGAEAKRGRGLELRALEKLRAVVGNQA